MKKNKVLAFLASIMMLSSATSVFAACKLSDSNSSSTSDSTASESVDVESSSTSSSDESSVKTEYTVTFDCVGGSEIDAQTIEKGSKVVKPTDPIREGYTFVEWKLDGLTYDFDSAVTGNITLVAVWQKDALKTFTVSFDVGEGSSVESKLVTEGGTVVAPISELEGKYIDSWTLNGETFDFNTPITEDITLVAVWKTGSLALNFETGSDVISINDAVKLSAVTDIDATVLFESSNEDIISVAQDGTLTIHAVGYAEITATIKSLSITQGICVLGDALSMDDLYMVKWSNADTTDYTEQEENDIISLSTTFAKWDNKNGIVWQFSQPKAYYQLLADKGYCIAFNIAISGANADDWRELRIYGKTLDEYGLNGKTGIIEIPLTAIIEKYERASVLGQSGHAAEASDFRNFFITCGYSDKIDRTFKIDMSGFDLRETGYQTKTVAFNSNGGTEVESIAVIENSSLLTFPVPTKEGYIFSGWTLNEEEYKLGTLVTEDITLTATWREPSFHISFAEGSGNVLETIGATSQLLVESEEPVVWTTSDETVATVDENGLVTAVADGLVEITATIAGESVKKTLVVENMALQMDQIKRVAWNWNDSLTVTETAEGYSFANTFEAGNYTRGIWLDWAQPKAYYELLAAKGYVLSFDITVSGEEAYNWNLIKVYGKTLEELGLTSREGTVYVEMADIVAAYDMIANFRNVPWNGGNALNGVASVSDYFLSMDRVNDYSRKYEFVVGNFKIEKAPAKHTVTFDVGEGTTVDAITVIEGTIISAPETTRENYFVKHWTLNGEVYDFSSPIAEDITLVAVWEEYSLALTVDGLDAELYEVGATLQLILNTNLTGEAVWSSSDATVASVENGLVSMVSGGEAVITVTVNGISATKKVSIVGIQVAADQLKRVAWNWNDSLTVTETAEGYSFANTFEAGNYTRGIWLDLTQPKSYYELLAANGYMLSFDITVSGEEAYNWNLVKVYGKSLSECGLVSASGKVYIEMADIVAAYDMLANFRNVPWNGGNALNGVASVSDYFLSMDRVNDYGRKYEFVVGNFKIEKAPMKHTVTFVSEGETLNALEVYYGLLVGIPNEPEREGYQFKGWLLDGEIYNFNNPVTSTITLTASWEKVEIYHTVSFEVGEGSQVESVSVKEGETVAEPTTTRQGYTFEGWLLNGEAYDFNAPVMEDITLTASWKKIAVYYEVAFDVGEGTPVTSQSVEEGTTATIPETTREGYRVKGWLLNGETFDFTTPINESITLVAEWEVYDFATQDLKFRQWGWNNKDFAPTEENGEVSITVAFEKWDNKTGILWQMPWSKAYYEALDAAGYDLYFDISVSGTSADQWQRLRVYGVHLDEYGVQNGQGTIRVDIATLIAKYDRVTALKGGAEALSSDFNVFFLTCDYSETIKTEVTITLSNIQFKPTATLNLALAEGKQDVIAKGDTTTLVANLLNCDASEITWSSSDETVATVVNGVVTGVKGGMATITATAGELTATKTVYVASADLKASDFNRMSWNWNQTNPSVTEVENGYTINATFGTGAAGVGYWVKLAQNKAYYEKLAAAGYSLTFDLTVGGEEAWNWKIVKVFGKTLEELGFTGKTGKVTISMAALVAAYDIQADLASKEMTNVAQSNYWFTIDRVNDYARAYTFTITNYEFIKAEV